MAVAEYYSRPIRLTASGLAINRPTRLSHWSVSAGAGDVVVYLRNGSSNAEILWEGEADASCASLNEDFSTPLNFTQGIYVDVVDGSQFNPRICLAVIEP